MGSNIGAEISSTFGFQSIGSLFTNLWGVAFTIGALAAFLYIILGAITWITGGGEKAKVEEAKERITQGIVGLAILAVSWAVALLVQQFLGLNIFGGGGGTGGGTPGGVGCQMVNNKCDGWADIGPTEHWNQDNCHIYICTASCWRDTGKIQPGCTPKP